MISAVEKAACDLGDAASHRAANAASASARLFVRLLLRKVFRAYEYFPYPVTVDRGPADGGCQERWKHTEMFLVCWALLNIEPLCYVVV